MIPLLATPAGGIPVSALVGALAFGAELAPVLRGWLAGRQRTVRLDTRLRERELHQAFHASVCRGAWSLADDGTPSGRATAVARSADVRVALRVGLRIVDSGGWRIAWIGALRPGGRPGRLADTVIVRRRVDAFVAEVLRRDPGAVRGRWVDR